MPSLRNHHSNSYVKLLLIGDAKSGKTTSLISLIKAGYWLGILDLDNLLDPLKGAIIHQCPDRLDQVEFRTLRDKRKASPTGPVIDGSPKAFVDAIKMLDRWRYKDEEGVEVDYGIPAEWGPERILVLDSLSRFCDAAYDFREPLALKGKSGDYDARAVYGDAQDAVESVLATLTSHSFATNVIVIAHGVYMDLPDGTKKIFPQGVGSKLSPKIPQYFPDVVQVTKKGNARTIQTVSTALIDLANPRPDVMPASLPLETGLAEFFRILKENPHEVKPATPASHQPLKLKRV